MFVACLLTSARRESPKSQFPKISQETLAEMVGTTRSRVSFFMNRVQAIGLHSLQR
jgi:CRP/FNR family cyclic AMP-dependent transcriptional regulator